jgi:hypothetical protein
MKRLWTRAVVLAIGWAALHVTSAAGQGTADCWRANWDQFRADCDLVTQRNNAWPKPFVCHDRWACYAMLQMNVTCGWEVAHTLTDTHFDLESNQLNSAGKAKVAWIMQNAPQDQKGIFVYQAIPGGEVETRLDSVRQWTEQWYSHLGPAHVAFTQRLPNNMSGAYSEAISLNYLQSLPTPALPSSTGSSLQSSASGN